MKVVFCADVHLDSSFREHAKDSAKQALRLQDAKNSFSRVIDTVKQSQAALLLIAGDLFDGNKITSDTLEFLKDAFRTIPDTYVFISPGNNDCATAISPYRTEQWPENVYIFTGNLEAVELALPDNGERIRIYGAGFRGHFTPAPLLSPTHLPELDPAYINILLMHASLDQSSTCNPITTELLNQCGFDFCVLGHAHTSSGVVALPNTFYAYPGSCEARNFGGSGGILTGSISHKYQDLKFIEVSSRRYIEASLDITGMESHNEIQQAILTNFPPNENLYRITLTGSPHSMLKLSLKSLTQALASDYFYIRLRASLSADTQGIQPLKTGLLQDYFLKEAAREISLETANPEVLRLAVQYGLAAFEGQEALEDVLDREEFWSHED